MWLGQGKRLAVVADTTRGMTVLTVLTLLMAAGCGTPAESGVGDTQSADTETADAQTSDAADSQGADSAIDTDVPNPAAWPAGEKGPYACGLRIVEMKYQLPEGLGERKVPLYVWYPASQEVGEHPIYENIFTDERSFLNAPLAPSPLAAGYPLLLHSHGHRGFSGNSAFLMCHIASHGWVALVPEHVGNTFSDFVDPRPLIAYLHRNLDMQHAMDWAVSPPVGDPLVGKIDVAHVGLSGHSYGTYTTWSVAGAPIDVAKLKERCAQTPPEWPDCSPALLKAFGGKMDDERVATFISMAGNGSDVFVPGGKNLVKRPMFQMNGSLDDSGQTSLYNDVTAVDLTWVNVEGGCHQLYGLGNAYLGSKECFDLKDEDGFAIVRPYYLAWLRYHALGDHGAEVTGIVTGKTQISPRVTFKHKTPQ